MHQNGSRACAEANIPLKVACPDDRACGMKICHNSLLRNSKMTLDAIVEFRLYVVGDLSNSRRAIENLQAYCKENLPGRHRIEVLDVFEAPERALADQIMLTPQLVVVSGGRTHYIVGDLSETLALSRAALDRAAR